MKFIKIMDQLSETLGGTVTYLYGGINVDEVTNSFITEENGIEIGYVIFFHDLIYNFHDRFFATVGSIALRFLIILVGALTLHHFFTKRKH